jgi:perosamine synthetase
MAVSVNEPLLDGNEKKYLIECIETGWISSEGPFIKRFEQEFAMRMGRQFGIAVANGSAALDAAVIALGIGEGDEVIMPTFTIISCAAAVVRAGAKPILVDSDHTWNIDVSQITSKITPRTKAIMAVHIYGLPSDMNPILAIAQKYGLKIIEDAAEMHGQTYYGQPCGSFGDISTFSFYPNKHVTTGEGGMILTDDPVLAERCRGARNLFFGKRRYIHHELGYNLRMTNLQAAVGVAQLERLDTFIAKKRHIGAMYTELLTSHPHLQLPIERTAYANNIYWVYGLMLKDNLKYDNDEACKRLAEYGIGTRQFFWNMHEQPVFRKMGWYENEHYPVAEKMARRGFYVPSGLALTDEQIFEVVDVLNKVII